MGEKGVMWLPLDDLTVWEENPNEGDVGAIYNSIKQFGYNDTIIVLGNELKAGNHRIPALKLIQRDLNRSDALTFINSSGQIEQLSPELFLQRSQTLWVNGGRWLVAAIDVTHLTPDEADAFALTHNRTTRRGMDDPKKLAAVLQKTQSIHQTLMTSTGFDLDDLGEVLKRLHPKNEESPLLEMTDVTIEDPKHIVSPGDAWNLGNHILICADIITEHHLWKNLLIPGIWFLPYPGVYVMETIQADHQTMLLVQPDPYICGHILDHYVAIHGTEELYKRD